MQNFTYCNPVRIVFGKGTISELPNLLEKGRKILLAYGGGSIKKNGVHEQVTKALAGFDVTEFGGIEPNPLHETCMRAVEIVRNRRIDFILAVGGGSVVDAAKYIAAAAVFDGDPWDILLATGENVKGALGLGCVLTLPATGSEMNYNSVISRASDKQKLHFGSPFVYPKFSILDPETTYSLPARQTTNGIVDAFVHVVEQYINREENTPLQDRMSEAVLSTLVQEGPKALANPRDYDARANIMWSATMALNGIIGMGVAQDWATHMIGHELTAVYGLDHAMTLAAVMPSYWRHDRRRKERKIIQMGERVFGLSGKDFEKTVRAVEDFFHSIGMKTTLADHGIDAGEAARELKTRLEARNAAFGEQEDIGPQAVFEITRKC